MPILTINRTPRSRRRDLVLVWNSLEYILHTRHLTVRERGKLLDKIDAAALAEDFAFLRSIPWITRIGWRSRYPRPNVRRSDRLAVLTAGRCAACGSTERLTVDHVRPLAKGGSNDRGNLQCLCWPCNHRKRDRWSEIDG